VAALAIVPNGDGTVVFIRQQRARNPHPDLVSHHSVSAFLGG
jgi:hypothetical protein